MRNLTAKPTRNIAGLLAGIALILAAYSADARSDLNRSINLAGGQWMLVEQMTNGTMLAVLGIDTEMNIRAVRSARDQFGRTLRGLRDGDSELGLAAADQQEVLEELALIEAVWPRYDQTLQTVVASLMASIDVTERQIRDLSVAHAQMIDAVDRTVDAFERFSHGGGVHSIVSTTLNASGQLRTHSQLMLGELLAVAHRDHEQQNRQLLGQATREFDRTLLGLMNGDTELRLLAAPTEEIKAELAKVQRLWTEIRPILERVSTGGSADVEAIAVVSRFTGRMIAPLNMASLMYENL